MKHFEVRDTSLSDAVGIDKMSAKVPTMFPKCFGCMHTQTALDFKLDLDVIAKRRIKDIPVT